MALDDFIDQDFVSKAELQELQWFENVGFWHDLLFDIGFVVINF